MLALVAGMLEVEQAVVLVVVLVRLQVLGLEMLVDVLIDVLVLLVKTLVAEALEVLPLAKGMLEVPLLVRLADVMHLM